MILLTDFKIGGAFYYDDYDNTLSEGIGRRKRDNGYDVADYRNIDPMFGTMEDLDNLIAEGEKRNIGLMFDMVFNHTSTSHEWFRRALAGEKNIRIIIYLRRGRRISPRQTGSQSLEVLHGNMYPLSENGICIYLM